MSAILLFCTAQVPAQVCSPPKYQPPISVHESPNLYLSQLINKLMEDCVLPDPDLAVNFFSLVRTPDQPDIDDWATVPPINDFTTGFLGKTDSELRRFPAERIPQVEHGQTIDQRWVAALDERSMSTQTVVLHHSYALNLWNKGLPGRSIPAGGEVFEDGRIWWKWRVPFKYAWTFYNSFDSDPTDTTLNLYARPELHKDDVVDMDTVQKIMDGNIGCNSEIP